jgi:hypothetical protein
MFNLLADAITLPPPHHSGLSFAEVLQWITYVAAVLYVLEKLGFVRRFLPDWARGLRLRLPKGLRRFLRLPRTPKASLGLGTVLIALALTVSFVPQYWKTVLPIVAAVVGLFALWLQYQREQRSDTRQIPMAAEEVQAAKLAEQRAGTREAISESGVNDLRIVSDRDRPPEAKTSHTVMRDRVELGVWTGDSMLAPQSVVCEVTDPDKKTTSSHVPTHRIPGVVGEVLGAAAPQYAKVLYPQEFENAGRLRAGRYRVRWIIRSQLNHLMATEELDTFTIW